MPDQMHENAAQGSRVLSASRRDNRERVKVASAIEFCLTDRVLSRHEARFDSSRFSIDTLHQPGSTGPRERETLQGHVSEEKETRWNISGRISRRTSEARSRRHLYKPFIACMGAPLRDRRRREGKGTKGEKEERRPIQRRCMRKKAKLRKHLANGDYHTLGLTRLDAHLYPCRLKETAAAASRPPHNR